MPLRPPVEQYAKRYGIPLSLAHALIGQESGGRADAVSPAGATGLTQVMPSTAAGMYGISEAEARRRLRDPNFALDAGFKYLAQQKKDFGTWRLALAAYNAGPNAVRQYDGVPPYAETRNYVRSILGRAGTMGATGQPAPAPQRPVRGDVGSIPTASTVLGNPLMAKPSLSGLASLAQGQYDPTAQLQQMLEGGDASAPASTPDRVPVGAGAQAPAPYKQPPGIATGSDTSWGKFVRLGPGADREGVNTHGAVLQFVGQLGQRAGRPLTIGTGTNHSQMTVNGNVSQHWGGMAADIPARGAELVRLGRLALIQAGADPAWARKQKGGLFNINGRQIIFNTHQGGDHTNHLHVGL